MVDVVELVDTPDCGSGAAALWVQVPSSTPMEEWLSGLKHRLGKAARVTPPQVRILFLPPHRGVVQRLVLRSPKPSMRVRILPPLPAYETSSVLLSSCGDTSRFGVNRLLARRIDTALKTKTQSREVQPPWGWVVRAS